MSDENIQVLLKQLNESEQEVIASYNRFLILQGMVWKKREKTALLKSKSELDVKVKSSKDHLKEIGGKNSHTTISKITCDKTVKNRLLRYNNLVTNIGNFNSNSNEKLKFLQDLQKQNEVEMFTKMQSQIIYNFSKTFNY